MKYDIILMDSDNTLLNYSRSEKVALFKTLKQYDIRPNKNLLKLYREINDRIWKEHEKGNINKSQIGQSRFKEFFARINKQIEPLEFNEKYMQTLSYTRYQIKGAYQTLKKLKKLGAKIYIVTNGTEWVQNRRLSCSSIKPFLDDVFVSEKAGYSKPDKRYFDYCFNKISNFDKTKTLLVGDSLTADIKGAINCDIDCCYFHPNRPASTSATYNATRLKQLIKIVK